MARRMIATLVVGLMLALVLSGSAQAGKSYSADRFDVQVEIQPDGSLIVTETVVFRFVGGPFTFAFRDLALTELDGIEGVQAGVNGQALPLGEGPGEVEIQSGRPIRVTWHFEPLYDATREFTLQYRVLGAIRQQDADTLVWRAIPEEHEYSIAGSTITLTFPSSTSLAEAPRLDVPFEVVDTDDTVRLTAGPLGENDSVVLTARFAPGSLIQAAPAWQASAQIRAEARRRAGPLALGAGLLAFALGGAVLILDAQRRRGDTPTLVLPPNPTPPMDLPAAVVGKLTGQGAGFLGTLFDLAGRGILEIQEERGWLGTRKHALRRVAPAEGLRAHERVLLEALFDGDKDSIDLSRVAERLSRRRSQFTDALDEEIAVRGWLDPDRQRQRRRLLGVWSLAAVASLGLILTGGLWLSSVLGQGAEAVAIPAALAGFGGGSLLATLVGLGTAASFSTHTAAGADQASRWKAFKEYLAGVARGREPAIRPDFFERYLPYAAAFGLGTRWAKTFQKLGGVPLPAWFHALDGSQADFGAIIPVMAATDSSAAGGGAAGGGGASGGGASGAG
jgi:hypothetical protein